MKYFLLLSFLLISILVSAQIDTIFKNKAYTSYYSFKLKNPLMVVYTLRNGGGDCNRSKFHFKNDGLGRRTAIASDYSHSGYDMGHLMNAEDKAYDCELDESSFRFWNCYPQTPQLNRGMWSAFEEDVRKLSKTDSLLILCGGIYNKNIIGNNVFVPDTCWKVVYSYTHNKIMFSYIFTNTTNPIKTDINIVKLTAILKKKHKIDLKKYIK